MQEGIEKLLTMLPSEEEVSRIEEAQELNPELPLGTAEQFLITLSSISGLIIPLPLLCFNIFLQVSRPDCDSGRSRLTLRTWRRRSANRWPT